MDDQELEKLLTGPESDRVERKESAADGERIRRVICAFANDLPDHRRPGVIFVGARDDGGCADLDLTDQLLQILSDMRSDGNITPFPTLTVQKRTLGGCELAVVAVHPADAPPVRFKGRVWIRVGPTTRVATTEEERRLGEKRRARDLPFDLRAVPSAAPRDLDLDLFERIYLRAALPAEILDRNDRTIEQHLTSMRMVDLDGHPTVLGILAIGVDPRGYVPGAYIQFLRIEGTRLGDPIKDQKEIDGPLPDLLRQLDEVLKVNLSVASDATTSPVEEQLPDYPLVALQQTTRNAVLHRTYEGTNAPVRITWFEDRVEIQNPGGPFGQVTRENFGVAGVTDYRNPHLAEAMKVLGYVQRFGTGIPMTRRELERNGSPPPEFLAEDAHVLVVLRRRA